jgi:hypothetical protein
MLKAFCGTRFLFARRVIFHVPQLDAPAVVFIFRRGQVHQSFYRMFARQKKSFSFAPALSRGYSNIALSGFQFKTFLTKWH